MVGSYNHCVDNDGNLLSNDRMMISGAMIENLGDAYEAIEEMYGMIWYLVKDHPDPVSAVEVARINYVEGLAFAKITSGKGEYRERQS